MVPDQDPSISRRYYGEFHTKQEARAEDECDAIDEQMLDQALYGSNSMQRFTNQYMNDV
jgi:hypothetical protein